VNLGPEIYGYVTQSDGEPAKPSAEEKNAVRAAAQEPPPDPEALLQELDGLCGLEQIKRDVKSLMNLVKVRKLRQENGLPVPDLSLHLVFLGNPGTGKTTVARLLSKLYHAIGVLSKGQLVEVDRSGLVAGFVGQTAMKTGDVLLSALGGVLFIERRPTSHGPAGERKRIWAGGDRGSLKG
jgi:SpoVK/Ycf46/Vps4 family AAA+-type ATPase